MYLLAFFPDTLKTFEDRDRKFVYRYGARARFRRSRRKYHRSIREKGTVTKAKSLFVGSLEISSKKSSH